MEGSDQKAEETKPCGRGVVISMDGSEASDAVLDWSVSQILEKEDKLTLIHAVEYGMVNRAGFSSGVAVLAGLNEAVKKEAKNKGKKYLQKMSKRAERLGMKPHGLQLILSPPTVPLKMSIAQYVEEEKPDILICGSRGMGALGRAFLGSTSDYIVHNTSCTIIIAKDSHVPTKPPAQLKEGTKDENKTEKSSETLTKDGNKTEKSSETLTKDGNEIEITSETLTKGENKKETSSETLASETKRSVVVSVDGSQASEDVVDWCMANVFRKEDKIIYVHAAEYGVAPYANAGMGGGGAFIVDVNSQLRDEAAKRGTKLLRRMAARSHEKGFKPSSLKILMVPIGLSGKATLCDFADDHNPSLFICGSRGLGIMGRAFVGSTSDYLIHNAKCPVMIVKTPATESKDGSTETPNAAVISA